MKNLFLLISVVFFLSACNDTPQEAASEESRLPNIVIIFTDDQGYQDVGCFGSPNIKTPNLDKMAREGLRFSQFYVSQPVCSASRSSLMTGCYADRLGISGAYGPQSKRGLNPEEMTIAEMLKPLGYATAVYGKWHLGDHPAMLPAKQGFDEYFGIPFSNDMWPKHPWQGTVFNFPPLPLYENETVIDTLEEQSMLTTWYTEHAVDFINRKKDEPFFLYLAHSMPHVPLYASEKFAGKSPRGLYGDVISEIDWSVGQVLKALQDNGLDENTLVIFTSDNGPWLSYGTHSGSALPLREGKGTAWEGGVRVPCIMRWPGKLEAGQTIEKPAMTIDILPTLAKLTGAEIPEWPIDGRDMSGLLEIYNDALPHHEAYYFYYKTNELHAVLSGDGRWKLYLPHTYRSLNGRTGTDDGLPIDYDQNTIEQPELYDLENDVSETTDVAAQHPEIVAVLMEEAEKARADLGDQLTGRTGAGVRPVGEFEWKMEN